MSGVKRYDISGFGGGMVEIEDGAWVHVDDYDRDTQSLRIAVEREKLSAEIERDAYDGQRRILDVVKAERDALRAQVEAMQALLVDAHWTVHLPTTEHGVIPRCRCRKCVISRIDAALQKGKP